MVRVLLISGSLRRGSSNSASLRTAAALAPQRVSASLYQGLEELPHFNPDEDAEGVQIAAPVARMRSQVGESDAILFCTPEYAGALPGAFKNLLEWMSAAPRSTAYRSPRSMWLGRGAGRTRRNLCGPCSATSGPSWLRRHLCESLTHDSIGSDGLLSDPGARRQIIAVLEVLAARVRDSEDHQ